MAGNATVGALRIVLGMDSASFEDGLKNSQKELSRAGAQFKRIGAEMSAIGVRLSAAFSVPLVTLGIGALKVAGDFESSMNRVEAATGASGEGLKALRDQAVAFGRDKSFTATAKDSADVMEILAKNGLTASQILNGASKATLKLAAATGAEFAPAGDLATDVVQQFGKKSSDLEDVVDKVTGALLVSKFGFEDYQAAIGQAGGVAGGLGMTFEDTNVAIAATASSFASGSDAGTSFKTFLTKLTPASKEAAGMIKALGLSFFDAEGKMRPIGDVAQNLRDKLSGLSDEAKTEALQKIFGTDSMRTAIGLMNQGADGIAKVRAEIDKASAQTQMEARMKGWNGGLVQLKKAAEAMAIAIGDSGLLGGVSRLISGLADLISAVSRTNPLLLRIVAIVAGFAAVVGPAILVAGQLALALGSMSTMASLLAPRLAAVAVQAGVAGGAVRLLGGALMMFLNPWVLAIGAIATVIGVAFVAATNNASTSTKTLGSVSAKTAQAIEDLNSIMDNDKTKIVAKNAEELTKRRREQAKATFEAANAELALREASAQARIRDLADGSVTEKTGPRGSYRERKLSTFQTRAGSELAREQGLAQKELGAVKAEAAQLKAAMDKALAGIAAPPPKLGGGGGVLAGSEGGQSSAISRPNAAEQRKELELQARLDAARLAGRTEEVRILERELDLKQRIQSYESAGLSAAAASVAAQRDLKAIDDSRAIARAKAIAEHADELSMTEAQALGDSRIVDLLERKAQKQQLITFYREQELSVGEATARAEMDLSRIEAARLVTRQRLTAEAKAEHDLELARLRGDSDGLIRARERVIELDHRAREIADREGVTLDDAKKKAGIELDEEDAARIQGVWRDAVKGGTRAALEGNFGDWARKWWADTVSKGMESGLNSLAGALQRIIGSLISRMANGAGSGIGGGIISGLATLVGGAAGFLGSQTLTSFKGVDGGAKSLTGFATGGSFKVGGSGGIDSQVRALRLTPGEQVTIDRDAPSRGERTLKVITEASPYFDTRVEEIAGPMAVRGAVAGAQGGSQMAQESLAQRGRHRFA